MTGVFVGTSGYSYKEWKGAFYPKDLPAKGFLRFYAEHFDTVEINNTFYRMPTRELASGWAREVPERFTFALKAPQRITHSGKLKDVTDSLDQFAQIAASLGERLGPLLFQLPPFFRKDVPRLEAFLDEVPRGLRVAFEFRHASWFDDDVWSALRARGAALCIAEGEALASPLVATADWGYVRLRRDHYDDRLLADWAARIAEQPWSRAYVYLKHDEGDAPRFAKELLARLAKPGFP